MRKLDWLDKYYAKKRNRDFEEVGKLAVEAIKKTGEHFNLRVPLTGEYKISNNWSGTH